MGADFFDQSAHIMDPLDLAGFQAKKSKEEAAAAADQYANSATRPGQIQWNPTYDPLSMSMAPGIQQQLGGVNLDTSGLNQFQAQAMRQGPSQWANQAGAQQDQLAANAIDLGGRQVAGQTAGARSQLAMRGGLTGGASERLAMEGQHNFMDMSQGIQQQNQTNHMQIGMNDESNRISQLGQLPGMQQQASQFGLNKIQMGGQAQQFDIGNQMANNQSRNDFNLGQYQAQMAEYGAAQTASAQARAGGHGKK